MQNTIAYNTQTSTDDSQKTTVWQCKYCTVTSFKVCHRKKIKNTFLLIIYNTYIVTHKTLRPKYDAISFFCVALDEAADSQYQKNITVQMHRGSQHICNFMLCCTVITLCFETALMMRISGLMMFKKAVILSELWKVSIYLYTQSI